MSLILRESFNITASSGDTFLDGNTILTEKNLVIDFAGDIPLTWEYIGFVFRLVQFGNLWVIAEQRELRPNKPNLCEWSDANPYKLSFRLVKYIRPGVLNVYGSQDDLIPQPALVALTGQYSDLEGIPATFPPAGHRHNATEIDNLPAGGSSFTFVGSEFPQNPQQGDTWMQLSSLGYFSEFWSWNDEFQAWLSQVRISSAIAGSMTGSSFTFFSKFEGQDTDQIWIDSVQYRLITVNSTGFFTLQPRGLRSSNTVGTSVDDAFFTSPEAASTGIEGIEQIDTVFSLPKLASDFLATYTRTAGTGNASAAFNVTYRRFMEPPVI